MDARGLPTPASLLEAASCGLLVLDSAGIIQFANSRFCFWSGYYSDAVIGKLRLSDLLSMGGKIFYQTHWSPLLQIQGSISEVKLMLRHQAGHELPVIANALRQTHEQGVFDHVAMFIAEDRHKYERELLAERKRAEGLLTSERSARSAADAAHDKLNAAASDRALLAEQMIGIVSHDLRNPLSAISVSASLLGMGELTAQQRKVLRRITNSTDRAQRMIADLLDFTQARVGRGLAVTPREFELKQLVIDSSDELTTAFPGRRVVSRHEGSGVCIADPDRLEQLIGNLVANALTYGDADKPVTIGSTICDTDFEISVHNFGPVIAPDRLGNVFEPMNRGSAVPSGSRNVGLGLFIVREIARAHGGDVVVTSTERLGTTFTARFPRVAGSNLRTAANSDFDT